jgi:hypothetical protein
MRCTWFAWIEKWTTRNEPPVAGDVFTAATAAVSARASTCSRNEGNPPRARSVTCTGWYLRCTGRARWGTRRVGPAFFFRPAPGRAPPHAPRAFAGAVKSPS